MLLLASPSGSAAPVAAAADPSAAALSACPWSFATDPGSNAYVIGDSKPKGDASWRCYGYVSDSIPCMLILSFLFRILCQSAGVCVVVLFAFCLCVVAVSMLILLSQIRG